MISFQQVFDVTNPISDYFHLTEEEARCLYSALVQVPPSGVIVEVGCQLGRSSSIIAQIKPFLDYRSIHIDPFLAAEWGTKWMEMMQHLSGIYGFTLLRMRTEQAVWHLDRLCSAGIDLAFIDGDHEKRGVAIDMELVAERVKPGGSLVCHDYAQPALPGVKEAIDAYVSIERWQHIGVYDTISWWKRKA
jgi:predicted O-methyltransferase YrrM